MKASHLEGFPAEIARRPPPNQAHLKYRPDIDGLRAIAVLPVIFYHYSLGFHGGFVGVDVFYVISGFLITKIIYDLALERKFSFIEFYDRRIRRLFPALFVMLAVVTAWAAVTMIWFDLRSYGESLFAATIYLSNFFFYVTTGYFMQAASTKPLLHTWSLAVEEQFYIVVPFVLFGLVRFVPKRAHVPALTALSAASFALCVWLTRVNTPAAFYLLPPRAWELGLGGVLAIAAPPVWKHRWLSEAISALGLALILLAVFAFSDATVFPGWRAAIPTLGAAALLSTGGRSRSIVERILSTPPFTFVGKISYSLYLWHWPVIVAATYAAGPSLAKELEALVVTFALSVASWKFVEIPLRQRRFLATAKGIFAGAIVASAISVAVALVIVVERGFPLRASPELRNLVTNPQWMATHRECHFVTARRAEKDQLCIRGASGARPSFVLVGDSHADALSEGLFAAAAARGLSGVQFTAPGFVPLPGRRALTSSPVADITPAFIAYLKRRPELRTVIVDGFWSVEVTGKSYRDAPRIYVDAQYDGSGAAYDPTAFRHALTRLVEMFPNRQFVLLDDVPTGPALDINSYARVVFAGRQPAIGLPLSEEEAQRATYEPILEGVAANHRNVRYLAVFKKLCGPSLCPLFLNGTPLYRDGDHLSRFASERLSGALAAPFAEWGRG